MNPITTPTMPPVSPVPSKSSSFLAKNWPLVVALLVVVLTVGMFSASKLTSANADYICTKVVPLSGECSNGSWGDWQDVSTVNDTQTCTIVTTQKRIYTGTREKQQTLQYLTLRTTCDPGYTQTVYGSSNGTSGFHGGSVVTEVATCQIEQTRVNKTPLTTGICAGAGNTGTGGAGAGGTGTGGAGATSGTSTTVMTGESVDTGTATTTSTKVNSMDEIRAAREALINGYIVAVPTLVRSGQTSSIRWSSQEMTSCTVSGTNGDSWQGLSGEKISKTLTQVTTYTLTCTAFNGKSFSTSTAVTIVPTWQEQ